MYILGKGVITSRQGAAHFYHLRMSLVVSLCVRLGSRIPLFSLPSPSLSAWAPVDCVRCSDPAVGRVARCADEGGELRSPFVSNRYNIGTAGFRCGEARNSDDPHEAGQVLQQRCP